MSSHHAASVGLEDSLIGGEWKFVQKVGAGSFGEIFLAVNVNTGKEAAIKIERASARHPQLIYEAKILRYLAGAPGIAQVYLATHEGDYNLMVMELLGSSLEDLFNLCNRHFSIKTILMIADQMLQRVEYLHSRNFIHRDIKPDNFLVGLNESKDTICMIDYGLAKRYRDPKTFYHIPYRDDKSLTGTARYASINAHQGVEQSRRDDLEAVGYVLLYFSRGSLPWQGIRAVSKQEKYQRIMEKKIATSIKQLCKGFPVQFSRYLQYVRTLHFEDRPDYAYLRRLFQELMVRGGWMYNAEWDWTKTLELHQHPHSASLIRRVDPELAEQLNQPMPILQSRGSSRHPRKSGIPRAPAGDLDSPFDPQHKQRQGEERRVLPAFPPERSRPPSPPPLWGYRRRNSETKKTTMRQYLPTKSFRKVAKCLPAICGGKSKEVTESDRQAPAG